MLFLSFWHGQATNKRVVSQIRSTGWRVASTKSNKVPVTLGIYGKCEMDSHADTGVAGSNYVILQYTGKVCDVSPYRDDYDIEKDVTIVHAATAWQSKETGQVYILVLHEFLWMGDSMSHTLWNPNQFHHYGTKVQDNPMTD